MVMAINHHRDIPDQRRCQSKNASAKGKSPIRIAGERVIGGMMQEVIADIDDKWTVVREKVSHCRGDRQTDNQRDADF